MMKPLMRQDDKRPWGFIIALIVAATAGLMSIPLQVMTQRVITDTAREETLRNRMLVEQVKGLEEDGNAEVAAHRVANQSDHDCIVALALLLADPDRPRDREVVPPAICNRAPAADNAESTEEPR